jgi:outer membrane protein TolC
MTRSAIGPLHPVRVQTAVLVLALAGLAAAAPAAAQLRPENPDSALARALRSVEGTPLGLEAATRLALEHATPAREARHALAAAAASVRREKGAFDPELYALATRSSEDRASASFFAGADVVETDATFTQFGAHMRSRWGTDLRASIETTRLETNSSFAFLRPQYDTAGRLEITQSLLHGFGPAARVELSAAERELDAAQAVYDDIVLDVRAQVEQAYWDLYAAERDYAVQQLIRDRAAQFLSDTQLRARSGLVGPVQVASARVFLAEQEQALLDRQERMDGVSDRLASLLGSRPDRPRFRPTAEPPSGFEPLEPDSVVALALRRNRAVESVRQDVQVFRSRAAGARWNALPTLDLMGSLGGTGLAGTGRDVVFGGDTLRTTVSGGYGDTWSQVLQGDFPTWSAGLRLSVPIGLRAGRGERDRLNAEVRAAEARLEGARRALEERVRGSHRELANAGRRVEAARDGVDASEEQVRIGLLEYQNGRSTAFELVRLGADLAAAQQRYSQALVRAAKAAATLRQLTAGAYPALSTPGE